MALSTFKALTQTSSEPRSWIKDVFVVIGASIIIALFAPVVIPLPFTPVPIATQMNVVLFLGAFLGSKRGALAVMAFIAQGAFGLPVFAGMKGGLFHLVGPSAGYLVGYIAGAYVTGLLVERMRERTPGRVFSAMALGSFAVYFFGVSWLSHFVGGVERAVVLGVLPFLIGDFFKLCIAVKGLKALRFLK